MPSQAMQDAIDALRDRQKAGAGQAPPALDERRAGFVPGGEGGAAFFQRRRGLAGTGLTPVPEGLDRVLHGLAWHVGISVSGLQAGGELCHDVRR